jgi:hypothetical protein
MLYVSAQPDFHLATEDFNLVLNKALTRQIRLESRFLSVILLTDDICLIPIKIWTTPQQHI